MKSMSTALVLVSCCATVLPLSAITVFSNHFEDGDLTPEVGTMTFGTGSFETAVIDTAASDATLGDKIGLFDQESTPTNIIDFTLNLVSTGSIIGGNTVTLDFDVAYRRTSGTTKVFFVDALDSSGDIVVRFILGDTGAFGNGSNDRQRPGYATLSGGNAVLPAPGTPGSFWWGADASETTFDINRDAHISLNISSSGFDISTTSQGGTVYSTTDLPTYDDTGSFTEIESIQFTSAGANAGIWLDNILVQAIPEPSTSLFGGLTIFGLLIRRRR